MDKDNSKTFLLVLLGLLTAFGPFVTDMYLPALPQLVHDLNTDMTQIELTISTFLIGFSLGQLFWGPASDRYGRRLPIMLGIGLFILGSVGCALAETAPQMLVWRVIQALGACAGPVLARAMVRDLYARERAAQMLSTLILIPTFYLIFDKRSRQERRAAKKLAKSQRSGKTGDAENE